MRGNGLIAVAFRKDVCHMGAHGVVQRVGKFLAARHRAVCRGGFASGEPGLELFGGIEAGAFQEQGKFPFVSGEVVAFERRKEMCRQDESVAPGQLVGDDGQVFEAFPQRGHFYFADFQMAVEFGEELSFRGQPLQVAMGCGDQPDA